MKIYLLFFLSMGIPYGLIKGFLAVARDGIQSGVISGLVSGILFGTVMSLAMGNWFNSWKKKLNVSKSDMVKTPRGELETISTDVNS